MKVNAPVRAALMNSDVLKAVPELVIDWNMNRYIGSVASNITGIEEFDNEYFPVESIIEPNRPTKGINKARVGSATIGDDYLIGSDATPNGRFYLADVDDIYKYWTSPDASNASTGALANCKPQVVYNATTAVNKIVITLENTWASPSTFNIQTTTTANPIEANWTTVATQASTPAGWKGKGQIVLYWNGTTWTNSNRAASGVTTNVRGVRIVVTGLEGGYKVTPDGSAVPSTYGSYSGSTYSTSNTDGKDARFDLIEISARLEVDITPYLITVDDTGEISDDSPLYPIGTLTSNQGSINLSNLYLSGGQWVPGLFSKENTASPYHDYIDANAEVNLRYHYFDENDNALGTIQQFKLYTETWTGQATDTVEVALSDHSKFFNETTLNAAMWENLTVPQLVWRILDSVGFVNYQIDSDADTVTEHVIPIFYTDGEQTVWQVLDELAKASQTAIYFDSYGKLQVKTRDFAFSPTDAAAWDMTADTVGGKLSDIISLEMQTEFEPNHYTVAYQKTNWSAVNAAGQPTLQKVWEPEGTVVLRATPMLRNMTAVDTYFWLEPVEAKTWPFEGIVNIDGEIMKYKGKEYVYYTGAGAGTANKKVVNSQDEANRLNDETPVGSRYKNRFTGALFVTERGAWNSNAVAHSVTPANYSVRGFVNGNNKTNVSGTRHSKQESKYILNPPQQYKDYKDVLVATVGDTDDTLFSHYGTKMRFVKGKGQNTQCAGIVLNNSGAGAGDGYYVELTPSSNITGKNSKDRAELILYSRTNNKDKRLGGKGQSLPIGENIDYEIDVYFNITGGSDHKIKVHVNGKEALTVTVSGANRQAANGKFGMFARGKTKTAHEYLYAVRKDEGDPPDDYSFLNKAENSYSGQQWKRDWVFEWKKNSRKVRRKTGDAKRRLNSYFVDEFGPYVHEIREFDVAFDPAPVLHSRVYNTNDWSSIVLEYSGDPFGAKFVMANTTRINAVVSGEDSLSFAGTGQNVNQILTVFGRALVIDEAEEVVAKNDEQIRRRGKIESEFSSPWIQSKAMADELRDWLNSTFSYGNDQLTVELFGNPLIEVGDVVSVTFAEKHIDGDYFVISVTNSFNQGLTTNATLRRRVRTG